MAITNSVHIALVHCVTMERLKKKNSSQKKEKCDTFKQTGTTNYTLK